MDEAAQPAVQLRRIARVERVDVERLLVRTHVDREGARRQGDEAGEEGRLHGAQVAHIEADERRMEHGSWAEDIAREREAREDELPDEAPGKGERAGRGAGVNA